MDFDHGNGNSDYIELGIGSSWREGGERSRHSSEKSESSKYSRRHLEFEYEPRSSRGSSEVSGRSRDSDVYPDIISKRGGNESNHSEITTESFKGWGYDNVFEIHQEAIDGSYSSKRSEVIQEENDMNEGHIVTSSTEKMKLPSSSPSSSSQSSTDDQFDDIKLSNSRSGITSIFSPKFHQDTEKSLKDEHHVSGYNSSKSGGQIGTAGVTRKSQVTSVTCESTSTQSPPIQVMDRLEDYDPNRIPSAVFTRSQSTTPADWSIASNESLFSIQVGNNSFSRDHILSLKSGELFKSGEFIAFSPSPVSPAVYTDTNSKELDKCEAAPVPDDAVKEKTGPSVEEPIPEKPKHPMVSWNASMNSKHSDDSATSFAFPIRKKKKKKEKEKKEKKKQKKCAWPSCYCSNCSWAFCHCTWPSCFCRWPSCCCRWPSCCCRWPSCCFRWPSCCFRWPSCNFRWPSCCFRWPSCCCSNCSWASCYCWNCSIKRWCCHFSTELTDRGNDGKKGKMEQQRQEQPLTSSAPSKSVCCSCWTCFPSCQCRCHWCFCCSCNCCCCDNS